MSRWFRSYDDALDDEKVQSLSGELFKAWYNLLCVTSKNSGKPFPLREIAFRLRIKENKAASIVRAFVACGLLDEVANNLYISHNWAARQFKSDTSKERTKKYRDRGRDVTVTPQNRTEQNKDDGGDARDPSFSIAEEIGKLCGYETAIDWPPGFCGAPHRVKAWLAQGLEREIMLSAVRESLARKRDGPPDSINYFEKPIVRAHANARAPIPIIKIVEAQTTEVRHEKSGSVHAAARNLKEKLADLNRPTPDFSREDELRSGAGGSPIRLISQG